MPQSSSRRQETPDGCSYDDECWMADGDCTPCQDGQIQAAEKDLISNSYVLKRDPVYCRTSDALKVTMGVANGFYSKWG